MNKEYNDEKDRKDDKYSDEKEYHDEIMTEKTARRLLCFTDGESITPELCKKKYRMMALKYHPDKNHDTDASLKFTRIHEAFEYLGGGKTQSYGGDDYKTTFLSFMKMIVGNNDETNEILFNIFSKISLLQKENVIPVLKKLVEKLDKDVLIKIHAIVQKYSDVFHISQVLSGVLLEVIREKHKNECCICLHPFIDDLFEEKLYNLVEKGDNYIVPLWHHELVYDDFTVKCIPVLCNHVRIDNFNHVHVSLSFTVEELWGVEEIRFELGGRVFAFERRLLYLREKQRHVLKRQGIPLINRRNIFDVSVKGDIVIEIEIRF
jgi:hypothetical protein